MERNGEGKRESRQKIDRSGARRVWHIKEESGADERLGGGGRRLGLSENKGRH